MSQKIVILGGRESGVGAALLAIAKGYQAFVSDFGQIIPAYKKELNEAAVSWEEGQHSLDEILQANTVVKSPGIPEKAPIIALIRKKGIPLISEIEFASQFIEQPILAITGSNGKTTTTDLCGRIMQTAGNNTAVGGNIGIALARLMAKGAHENYVVELSSFQLDDIIKFRPKVAVLLNLTPDHLDRYEYSIDAYGEAKFNITKNQLAGDSFIYCSDDLWTAQRVAKHEFSANVYAFGQNKSSEKAAWMEADSLCFQFDNYDFSIPLSDIRLKGIHNYYNAMAAGISCLLMGAQEKDLRESLATYAAPQHRMEEVTEIDEVLFINDSKATNVVSVKYALQAMDRPVVWIAGGTDKGNDYSELETLVKEKVKTIICLGIDNSPLLQAFSDEKECRETQSMEQAVAWSKSTASQGDVVLLSPACASFDLFKNYEDRGQQFIDAVYQLNQKNTAV